MKNQYLKVQCDTSSDDESKESNSPSSTDHVKDIFTNLTPNSI